MVLTSTIVPPVGATHGVETKQGVVASILFCGHYVALGGNFKVKAWKRI